MRERGGQGLHTQTHRHAQVRLAHRDLKPSNVLVRSDGRVMLQDFGNGRRLDSTQHDMETFVGCALCLPPACIDGEYVHT